MELNKNRRGMSEFPISGKVEAKIGEQSIDKLVDALVDTFSPATELLGAIGDGVRLARVEIAAHITRRAKKLAEDNGLTLKAPPLKFLLPFFEKASIEEDSELVEAWTALLVSAGSQFNSEQIIFSDILSKISSREALILSDMWNRSKSRTIMNFDREVHASIISNFRAKLIEKKKYEDLDYIKPEIEDWVANPEIKKYGFNLYFMLLEVSVEFGSMETIYTPKDIELSGSAYEILKREGLVEINLHTISLFGRKIRNDYAWVELTQLGCSFSQAVSAEKR